MTDQEIRRLFHAWAFGERGGIHAIGGDELIEHMRLEDAAAVFLAGHRLAESERDHALAHAYWRGMLARDIADAEATAQRLAESGAVAIEVRGDRDENVYALDHTHYERRAARLRAIAESEMWLPWWKRKAGAR